MSDRLDPTTHDPPDGARQWLGGGRASGIAGVVVLVLAVLVMLVNGHDGRPESADLAPSTVSSSSAVGTAGRASDGREGARVLTAPPPDVTWQTWHSLVLPNSPSAGPRKVEGQAAAGFTRTPAGALVASVHSVGRLAAALDPDWESVVETMAAAGPGRARWIEARRAVRIVATQQPGTFALVAGFRFVSYTVDEAAVELVTRNSDLRLNVALVHMRWVDGDWKIVLTPAGGTSGPVQIITSMDGYVSWGVLQ